MDLRDYWKPKEDGPDKPVVVNKEKLDRASCLSPMCVLKKNITYNFYIGVAIMAFWMYLIWAFPQWPIRLCFILIAAITAYMLFDTYKIFKSIDTDCMEDTHLLTELKSHCLRIEKWMKNSSILGLLMYPFSATGGFLIGGIKGSGLPVETLLKDPAILWTLAIAVVVLTPLSYLLGRWMNHQAFGKHLAKIKNMVKELEE